MSKIDIVIPYVDNTREKWRKLYEEYAEKEGVFHGPSDARDYGTLKYLFRSIEKNCQWVNNVFLVVQDEDQVPEWVNKNEVKIVYHRDYIPKELLPTFSPYNIEGFYSCIDGLEERYVDVNDDMFFINTIPVEKYFNNGLPVMDNTTINGATYLEGYGPEFGESIDQGVKIERKYGGPDALYFPYHFPAPHLKSVERKILEENYDEIIKTQSASHIRTTKQIALRETLGNITKRLGKYILDSSCLNGLWYTQIYDGEDFSAYDNAMVVCFNDADIVDFESMRENLISYFEKHFPNKSRYEK